MIILSGVLVVVAIALLVAGIVAGNGDSAQVFGVDAIVVIYTSIAVSLVSALCLLIGVLLRRKEIFGGGTAASPRRDRKAAKAAKGKKGKSAVQAVPPGVPQRAGDGDQDDEVAIPQQPMDVPDDAIVFVVRGRKRYHLDTCRQLAGRDTEELTYVEAREEGFSPCTACLPDTALAARASVSVGAPSGPGGPGGPQGDAPSGPASRGPVASAASPSAPPAPPVTPVPPKSDTPSVPSAWPTPAASAPPAASSGRGDVTLPDIPVTGPASEPENEAPPAAQTLMDIPLPTIDPEPEPAPEPEPEPEVKAEVKAEAVAVEVKRDEVVEKPSEAPSTDVTPEPEEREAPAPAVADEAPATPVEDAPAETAPVEDTADEDEPAETTAEVEEPQAEEAEEQPVALAAAPPRPRESSDGSESPEVKDEVAEVESEAEDEKSEAVAKDEPAAEAETGVDGEAGTTEDEDEVGEASDQASDQASGEEPADAEEPQVRILSGTKRYHRPDCALIEDIGDDAEDLESLPRSEAKERGCTPCLVCQPDREHARD
ncbi:hypothetical protein [Actinomadura harenae]|uniref:hypothetical protein n=1 Tax=Actinomadura harenae TaxID=2483351 RepID=UPI00131592E5|nr:hypothetical protein [Actinomadura harenae]